MVCARGSWDATSDGAMALALLGSKLRNTPVLQMSNALYIPNGAGKNNKGHLPLRLIAYPNVYQSCPPFHTSDQNNDGL